jgi:Uma2 family endonuclease
MVVAHQPRHWSREEYDRMVDAGILGPEDRLELIEGEILTMAPQKSPHVTGVHLVSEVLREAFRGREAVVRSQAPLALDDESEPEPDVAVVEGRSLREFRGAHPRTALLIVEVADSSLAFDRGRKLALYARAGIPEYWVLNLIDGALEVYREPAGDRYRSATVLGSGDAVRPAAAPGAEILVGDLLP